MTYCYIFVDSSDYKAGHSYYHLYTLSLFQNKSLASVYVDYESSKSVARVSALGPLQTSLTVTTPCRSYCSSICLLWSGGTASASPGTYGGQLYVWDGQLWYVTLLLFFPQNVLVSIRGTAMSHFRHGLIQCFPTNCTVELFGVGKKSVPGRNKLSVLKMKCSKIPLYWLTALETFHGTLSLVVNLNRICWL